MSASNKNLKIVIKKISLIAVLIFATISFRNMVVTMLGINASRFYLQHDAKITGVSVLGCRSGGVMCSCAARYNFDVNGEKTGGYVLGPALNETQCDPQFKSKYKLGKSVMAYYNPHNLSITDLTTNYFTGGYILMQLILTLFFLGIAAGLTLPDWMRRINY